MAYKVRITTEFEALLDEAVSFRVDNYGLRSARRLLDSVDEACELLASMPHMGSLLEQPTSSSSRKGTLRWVKVDSYIAVYRVHDERQEVALLKLFRAASNWRKRVCS